MNNQIDTKSDLDSRTATPARDNSCGSRLTNEEIRRQLGWGMFESAQSSRHGPSPRAFAGLGKMT